MKRLLNTQSGFSIMELMIGAGIAGGVALVGSQLLSDHVSHKKHLEDKSAITRVTQLARFALADRENCAANFRSIPISQSFASPVSVGRIVNAAGNPVLTAPSQQGSFSLEDISIVRNPTAPNILDYVLTYNWGKRKFNNDNRQDPNLSSRIVQRVSVNVNVDPGRVTPDGDTVDPSWKCGEVLTDDREKLKKEICESLGELAVWDDAAGSCRIKEIKCENEDEVPVMTTSLGNYTCKKAVDMINAAEMINPVETPCPAGRSVSIIVDSNGKLKLSCPP
jgi:hypothetical protein